MQKIEKIFSTTLLAAIATVLIPLNVNAATVKAEVNKETMAVGDTLTLSITTEDEETSAVAPEISITFDPNRLSFTACTTAYGGGDGGLVTVSESAADMTFTAISGGSAGIDVSAIYDGDGANPSMASCTVDVDGEDTAAMMGEETSTSTGVTPGQITSTDGTKIVSSVFADEFMPKGFYKTTVTYEEQVVEAAQFDMGNIVLLYVTDPTGVDGTFCIYDQTTGELKDFLQISGIENRFIIALNAGPEVTVPDNFTKATLQWNSKVLEAYAYTGDAAAADGPQINDFFLLYAMSSEGNTGWYMYDQNEGTYQRFVQGLYGGKKTQEIGDGILSAITSPSESNGEGGIDIKLIIIIIMAVIMVVMIVMLIITMVKLKDFESYDYIDEDEEYEGVPEESGLQPSFVRNKTTEDIPDLMESEADKPDESEFKFRKVKASDLVERDMPLYNQDDEDEEPDEDESIFNPHMKPTREEKRLAKAEAKAAKKAEKKRRKELGDYGDNGYVDWESFGNEIKEQGTAPMPTAEPNPYYNMDKINSPVEQEEEIPFKPVSNKRRAVTEEDYPAEQPMEQMMEKPLEPSRSRMKHAKENPMDMMRNIPANDSNRPVQPRPVQQVDLDEDFEFEFLKLDDD